MNICPQADRLKAPLFFYELSRSSGSCFIATTQRYKYTTRDHLAEQMVSPVVAPLDSSLTFQSAELVAC